MKLMKRDNQMSPYVSPLDAIFERLNWGLPTMDRVFSDFDEQGSRIVAMSFCEPRSCIGRLSS